MADGGLNRWLMPPRATCTCQQEWPLCAVTQPGGVDSGKRFLPPTALAAKQSPGRLMVLPWKNFLPFGKACDAP